jgi:tetratricopeptide (TPR) repeat protein
MLRVHDRYRPLLFALLALGAAGSGLAAAGRPAATPPGGLSWRGLDGREYAAQAAGATVLLFGSTTCPCADGYVDRLVALAREPTRPPARFFVVFSGPGETAAGVRAYAARRGLTMPVVLDDGGRLAVGLGARVTPTAVLLDAAGAVAYAGRFDDSPDPRLVKAQYLRDALAAVLRGQPPRQARTRAFGCATAADPPAPGPAPATGPARAKLFPGLGKVGLKATTRSAEAQRYFQQGLALWYGFNFDEAERSFRTAAQLDPECALAPWGIALSLGMNYNWDFDPAKEGECHAAVQRALALAPKASEREQALIRALAQRHTNAPNPDRGQLLRAYADAMRRVAADYPGDPDVAVLFAASMMDLRPWQLWTGNGQPRPGTLEIVAALERALKKDPDHMGAHHLYIHAMEKSPRPERALPSAAALAGLAPLSGHLVHMPAHIYQRVGDFRRAAAHNRWGADVDTPYVVREQVKGRYLAYYIHNLDFLAFSHTMAGRSQDAVATARELADVVARHRPALRSPLCPSAPLVAADILVRFRRWDDILKASAPAADDHSGRLYDRYARGAALAAKGDAAGAKQQLQGIDTAVAALGPAFAAGAAGTPYEKSAPLLIQAARSTLAGRIALANGDVAGAVAAFRQAIEAEDALPYAEPPLWRSPIREALGGALLRAGRAGAAEAVFRADLRRNPGSGRSLFGLMKSLEAQKKSREARAVAVQYRKAWENADVTLTVAGL